MFNIAIWPARSPRTFQDRSSPTRATVKTAWESGLGPRQYGSLKNLTAFRTASKAHRPSVTQHHSRPWCSKLTMETRPATWRG